ncbi:helix-turn-helix domain-containing protein [Bdellovibrio bacteriovorus]|uniref:helix-turn-helix domain-containing protein n=1 Tax=Bdellovibrio bacteriovorus TaxID=959 RepID=UPI0035A637D4
MKTFEPTIAISANLAILDQLYRGNRKNRTSSRHILDFSASEIHGPDHLISGHRLVKTDETHTRSLTTEEWLDSVEAAAYLKVSLGALRNMTSNGQVPFYKMGKRNRYRIEELRQLLLSQKRGASNGN